MKLLVTGSGGLIGCEAAEYFCRKGWQVTGIDNNMRADFFGPAGDTSHNQARLTQNFKEFKPVNLDIRNRNAIAELIKSWKPDAIIHTAAQPSHDLAAKRVFDDFEVNALGTLNLLEAARNYCGEAPFVHFSTNKVYGDGPNRLALVEKEKRWDYAEPEYADGIDETFSIDHSMHSLFGASKLSADILVQEYGRYFGMPTCCLRAGCLTGPMHSGVELHGFLNYLIKCNVEERKYTVYGYKGKQVRDNIHSRDVTRFAECFIESPRCAEVYNLGGGRENSISILEAFDLIESISGKPMIYDYSEENRKGDHICYISNLKKTRSHYPDWDIGIDIETVFRQIFEYVR